MCVTFNLNDLGEKVTLLLRTDKIVMNKKEIKKVKPAAVKQMIALLGPSLNSGISNWERYILLYWLDWEILSSKNLIVSSEIFESLSFKYESSSSRTISNNLLEFSGEWWFIPIVINGVSLGADFVKCSL